LGILTIVLFKYIYNSNKESLKKGVLNTDIDSTTMEKNDRQSTRGMIISIVLSIILASLTFGADKFNADTSTSALLIGFILAPMIGYMGDIGFASEQGLRLSISDEVQETKLFGLFNKKGSDYIYGNLSNSKYIRYFLTVLLDLFISVPIYTVIVNQFAETSYMSIISGIVSSLIGVITFQAYTNQTRFLWAYPDPDTDHNTWIKSPTILLSTAIAGVMFLTGPKVLKEGSFTNDPWFRIGLVILSLSMMSLMYITGTLSSPRKNVIVPVRTIDESGNTTISFKEESDKIPSNEDIMDKNKIGRMIFTTISSLCIGGTIMSIKGIDPKIKYLSIGGATGLLTAFSIVT
jgi:hypothetical protein